MFRLAWHTPPEWVRRVEERALELLSDHAHCERKAEATARALIRRAPGSPELAARLSELAREESEHCALVTEELARRGGELRPDRESPYAKGLLARCSASGGLDLCGRLVVAGLIEARSLERFYLLAEHLEDEGLAALYRRLLSSEASHRALFFGLARELFPGACAARIAALTAAEGELIAGLPFAARVHSGVADEVGAGAA